MILAASARFMLALLRAGSRLAPKSLAPPFLGQKPRRMAYKPLYMKKPRPLTSQDGPLVWIDCEMTGLDFKKHKLLEIAVIITNGDLKRVDKGIDYVIRTDKADLDQMDEWCTRTHGETGLTKACLESENGHEWVESTVLEYIKKWVPTQRTAILAGSSVHFDRGFLTEHMPSLTDWLHYRIVDVSSVKEITRRWFPKTRRNSDEFIGEGTLHRALDDIEASIRELQWYRENVFIKSPFSEEATDPAPKE